MNKMPLIVFSINTIHAAGSPVGIGDDGSFRLRHVFNRLPPPETIFKLKHVSFDAGGDRQPGGARNLDTTQWVSVDFPQLTDEIVHKQSQTEVVNGQVNDLGILRFPLSTFVINGRLNEETNERDRRGGSDEASAFTQRGNHELDINLGTFRLEEGYIDCVITPRNPLGETKVVGSKARMRQIQVILEYN